jgi:hypothetical protein
LNKKKRSSIFDYFTDGRGIFEDMLCGVIIGRGGGHTIPAGLF